MRVYVRPCSYTCNMSCENCFEREMKSKRNLDDGCLMDTSLFDEIIKDEELVEYYFIGGEPLLAPVSFYQEFVSKLKRKAVLILETNGLLVDQRWAKFFKDNGFIIRLKLDITSPSFSKVMNNYRLLKKNQINVIMVNKISNKVNPEKLMEFYLSEDVENVSFDFISYTGYKLTPKQYHYFLTILFRLWKKAFKEGKYIYIDYFIDIMADLKGHGGESCCYFGKCKRVEVINSDGQVYPCKYYVYDKYLKGEVTGELSKQCLDCPYVKQCFGGCIKEREIIFNDAFCGKRTFITDCYFDIVEMSNYIE